MDELVLSGELLPTLQPKELDCGVVRAVTAEGVQLSIGDQKLQKNYSFIVTGQSLASGDRVLVAHVSGTYIVIGKIGT